MRQKIHKFSDKLVLQISKDEEECEILRYGLHQRCVIAVNFLSVVISGIIWNELVFSFLLFLTLFFLRPYAGGYHADTENRCYFISVGIMNFALAGVKFINISVDLMIVLYLSVLIIAWKNAPVANPINPLEDAEKQIYSKKAKKILVGYSLIVGGGMYLQAKVLYESIFYGTMITAFSIVIGKCKNRVKDCSLGITAKHYNTASKTYSAYRTAYAFTGYSVI